MRHKYRTSWFNQPSNKFHFKDGEGEGGGGGGGGDGDTFTKEQFDAAVADATTNATTAATDVATAEFEEKRKTLLDETKAAKEAVKKWKDFDFDNVSKMMAAFGESEEAKLIADGKWEEVVEKRINKQKAEWESSKVELSDAITTVTAERDSYKSMYENKLTDIQIRAAAEKASVIPTAIDDIVTRGLIIFAVDSEGNLEARDAKGDLMKTESGILLTPELFIEGLRESAPHYWPPSEGSGGEGSKTGADGKKLSIHQQKADAAKRGDMTEYDRLTAVQKKNKAEGIKE